MNDNNNYDDSMLVDENYISGSNESSDDGQHQYKINDVKRNNFVFPPRKTYDAVLKSDGTMGRIKSGKAKDSVLNQDGSISRDKSFFPRKTRDSVLKSDGILGKTRSSLFSTNKEAELNSSDDEKRGISFAFNKLSPKVKLIIIGCVAGFAVFMMIFLVVVVTPLMELGIIDIEGMGGSSSIPSYSYSSIGSNVKYWWPIGSSDTVNQNGILVASGTPVKTEITSNFGPRIHPITGESSVHTGVDIADGSSPGTTNIIAAKEGTVIYPTNSDRRDCPSSSSLDGCGGGYGNYVMIRHNDGTVTLYAHLHANTVNVISGSEVVQGQVIGKMGTSGNSTGTHLHFEVRASGNAVNPLNYVNRDNSRPTN